MLLDHYNTTNITQFKLTMKIHDEDPINLTTIIIIKDNHKYANNNYLRIFGYGNLTGLCGVTTTSLPQPRFVNKDSIPISVLSKAVFTSILVMDNPHWYPLKQFFFFF